MLNCKNCGIENKDEAKFCTSCGSTMALGVDAKPVLSDPVACASCQAPLAADAKFCKKCGTGVAGPVSSSAPEVAVADKYDEIFKDSTRPVSIDLASPDSHQITEISLDEVNTSSLASLDLGDDQVSSAPPASLLAAAASPSSSPPPLTVPPEAFTASLPDQSGPAVSPVVEQNKVHNPIPAVSGDVIKSSMQPSHVIAAGIAVLLVIAASAGGYFWFSSTKPKNELALNEKTTAVNQPVAADMPVTASANTAVIKDVVPASLPETSVIPAPASVAEPVAVAPAAAIPPAVPDIVTANVPNVKKKARKNGDDDFDEEDDYDNDMSAQGKRQRGLHAQNQEFVRAAPFGGDMGAMGRGQVSALLARSDSFMASGDYDRAIATAQSALALDPNNAAARAKIKKARRLQGE
ncbi:zinc-ribbon domain-containing protein [Undibacterium sp. Di27W]|uniref:zinc-ribbon domain-containing protein n=1 Tax=Undibacterium sp. Di27W TaxID=3413036 RepID=UPI003BF0FA40